MKDAPADEKAKEAEKQPVAVPEPAKPLAVLRSNLRLINNAVAQKETRTLFGRVLRQTAAVRNRLSARDVQAFLTSSLPASSSVAQQLLGALKQVGGLSIMRVERCKLCAVLPPHALPPNNPTDTAQQSLKATSLSFACHAAAGGQRNGCGRCSSQRRSSGGAGCRCCCSVSTCCPAARG